MVGVPGVELLQPKVTRPPVIVLIEDIPLDQLRDIERDIDILAPL